MQRDIQLPDCAERLSQTANLLLGLAGMSVMQAGGEHGDRLAQPPRRDARLMHTDVGAGDRGREMSPQRTRATLEKSDQG